MKEITPLKFSLKELIGTSPFMSSVGTAKRVPATTYSVFSVINGEEWLPAEFGNSIISSVLKVLRFTLATRGVLFAFAKIHLPSCSPFV